MPAEHLESIRFHHFLLQAASGAVTWEPPTPGPASLLFYECQADPDDPALNFDYYDNLHSPILAIRAGTIGIVAVLQDWGLMETIQEKRLVAARHLALHPTQFRELFAMISYIAETNWVSGRENIVLQPPHDDQPVIVITPEVSMPDRGDGAH